MNKVYEINGIVETSKIFHVGTKAIRCKFSGGAVNEDQMMPAIYSTKDFAVQTIIEHSEDFKDGFITFSKETNIAIAEEEAKETKEKAKKNKEDSQRKIDEAKKADKAKEDAEQPKAVDYPDVVNSQQAKNILVGEPYNVTLDLLTNKAAILSKADELKVTFSNWK